MTLPPHTHSTYTAHAHAHTNIYTYTDIYTYVYRALSILIIAYTHNTCKCMYAHPHNSISHLRRHSHGNTNAVTANSHQRQAQHSQPSSAPEGAHSSVHCPPANSGGGLAKTSWNGRGCVFCLLCGGWLHVLKEGWQHRGFTKVGAVAVASAIARAFISEITVSPSGPAVVIVEHRRQQSGG